MISDKVLELINRDLDGTLTKAEKEELQKLLEKDTESKEMLVKLQRLHKTLGEIPQVEPPSDIKDNVMRALPLRGEARKAADSSVITKIVDLFTVPRFQLAGMFSLGAAAAALLFSLVTNNGANQSPTDNLVGTIITQAETVDATQVDYKNVEVSGINVSIKTSRLDRTVFVSIVVSSESNQIIQVLAQSETAENFRFTGMEYQAPNLVYANFGNGFFSAAVAGSGTWLLAFEDPDDATDKLEIELKTDTDSVTETLGIQ